MDATEMVIGENGLKALLNFAKMPYLYENKPDYGYDKNYTDEEYARLSSATTTCSGYHGRQVGLPRDRKSHRVKRTTGLGLFDSFQGASPGRAPALKPSSSTR